MIRPERREGTAGDMETFPKKQIRLICEAPIATRIRKILSRAPITGYTILPAIGGSGSEGSWMREGLVGDAGQMLVFLIILDEDQLQAVLEQLYGGIRAQMGIITISDVDVVRPELF